MRGAAVVTCPPWGENFEVCVDVLAALRVPEIVTLWRSTDTPPVRHLPLLTIHVWQHEGRTDGKAFQLFYQYGMAGTPEPDLMSWPAIVDGPHPQTQPWQVMQWAAAKTDAMAPLYD